METLPKPLAPEGIKLKPEDLAARKYGSYEMVNIWGYEKTVDYSLKVQGQSCLILSKLAPNIISEDHAKRLNEKANLNYVKIERVRELEAKTGHDIIAINTSLEEVLDQELKPHPNKLKTSADTTQPARALQLKASLEIIADSLENLRDIVIEKSVKWINYPSIDLTHLYDALPTVAGRPFAHYAEMLQSNLDFLKIIYKKSIIGKWADATGNHHSAKSLGVDGLLLEDEFCNSLGINHMIAPAQIPGLEFESDIVYVAARSSETLNNLAQFIAYGRGDDCNIFINGNPKKKKGSSAMPHKDAKNGNPDIEEQIKSIRNKMQGWLTTSLSNCELPYARTLYASANSRIDFEDGFKFLDHGIRRLAEVVYWLNLNEDRSEERVKRSFGVVTSQQVLNYLTSQDHVKNPMPRSEAHNLMGEIATKAWTSKTHFIDLLLQNKEVTSRINEETLRRISNPLEYVGESKKIIQLVKENFYKKKTLE